MADSNYALCILRAVQRSLAQTEVNLQKEIEQGRVPNNVDACRMIIRQILGIRRCIENKDVEE